MAITASEQLMIEMINRARLDPLGEAARFDIDLNADLVAGTLDGTARSALAPNVLLHASSDTHGQWMLDEDKFQHEGEGDNAPRDRMESAGYVFKGTNASGENLTYRGSTGSIDEVALMRDDHHKDLFLSAGHRANMLFEGYRELGVSQLEGIFTGENGTDYNTSMVVVNFAKSGSDLFVTGVAYNDTDGDEFYSVGEAQSGVAVAAQGQSGTTLSAGGYAFAVTRTPTADVTLGAISMTVDVSQVNAKVDLVDGTDVKTSVDTTLSSAAGSLTALGVGDIDLTGHSGADTLVGNAGDNRLSGGDGGDVLIGGAGDDALYGGDGTDRAVFDFARADAEITQTDGAVRVSANGTVDDAFDIEEFVFTDGVFSMDDLFPPEPDQVFSGGTGGQTFVGGTGDDLFYGDGVSLAHTPDAASQVYRLYRATLDRAPDFAGFKGWTATLFEERQTLQDVAQGFIGSIEFVTRYGSLSNSDFVEALYQNVLNRGADAGGLANWLNLIDSGGSRAQVVTGFSESLEFKAATQTSATAFSEAGTASLWTDDIYRLYRATLDRDPDSSGFNNWANALSNGAQSYLSVATLFTESPEFEQSYGELDDNAFVSLLYHNVLDRAPDLAGLLGWVNSLTTGSTRSEVVRGFAQSAEFKTNTTDDLLDWARDIDSDVFHAGGGNDTMIGGQLSDTFVFDAADGGAHRVLDLEAWDFVQLHGFGFATTTEAKAQFTTIDEDVVFEEAGMRVTFENADLSLITDEMILI